MARGPLVADYMPPRLGPFRCGHCQYANRSGRFGLECVDPEAVHDIVTTDPVRRLPDGRARIEHGGCCNFYRSVTETA